MTLPQNIAVVFDAIADEIGDRVAVVQGGRRITWSALREDAERVAAGLAALGVGAGSRVGFALWNGPEFVAGLYAVFSIGATAFNINYRYRATELTQVLNDAGAEVVIVDAAVLPEMLAAQEGVPTLSTIVVLGSAMSGTDVVTFDALERDAQAHDTQATAQWLLYTGGTTGAPKGVLMDHSTVLRTIASIAYDRVGRARPDSLDGVVEAARKHAAQRRRSVFLVGAPMIHGTGFYNSIGALVGGCAVVYTEGRSFSPEEYLDLIERERVTDLVLVGDAIARPLLEALDALPADRAAAAVASLERIFSVGVVFSADTKTGLLRHADLRIHDIISASEGGPFAVSITQRGEIVPTSHFELVPGAAVIREDGSVAGPDEPGLLACPAAPSTEYLGNAEKTSEVFRQFGETRWCVPGDMARVSADGVLTLLGRGNRVINTGGEKVFVEEIELALAGLDGVREAIVVGLPDPRWGARIAAMVEREPQTTVDAVALDEGLRRSLAGYKVPRRYQFVDRLERTASGKPDLAWATRILSEKAAEEAIRPPANATPKE